MPHILIVDDDEIVAELAANALMDAGYAAGWVSDAEQAMKLLEWRRPDLVLLDQNMPGENGSTMLRRLRQSEDFYDLPVLMFTSVTGDQDEATALYNGAQGYLRKPVDPKFLLWKVNQAMALRPENGHRKVAETMHLPHLDRRDEDRPVPLKRAV